MNDRQLYDEFVSSSDSFHVNSTNYQDKITSSLTDGESFWQEEARIIDWIEPFSKVNDSTFDPVSINWFVNGKLNACCNCVDRYAKKYPDRIAMILEKNQPGMSSSVTFYELYRQVCALGNALRSLGVSKGDRVCIYLPMIPQAVYAMLACARIGAVHTVVFAGFSAKSLAERINDAGAKIVITADEGRRGEKNIPLKNVVDNALVNCSSVENVVVVRNTKADVGFDQQRDIWYHHLVKVDDENCQPAVMDAKDPLFIMYTSGSTGKPKGAVHSTGGYLVYAATTFRYTFDYKPGEVFWCTADVGWITGHSYLVYGPLACGATIVLFEGVPCYPESSRWWRVVDKHKVNIFYTSPTAIRGLMQFGDNSLQGTCRDSLRVLGSVGEPLNSEAWRWYYEKVGKSRCPIVDTWWQTETGGFLITPLPGANFLKPGSVAKPFFSIRPQLIDSNGKVVEGKGEGDLCFSSSWPGQAVSLWKNHKGFVEIYFSKHKGLYFSGDGAKRDEDGYYWVTGRVDDVLNVSGRLVGTAEIEAAIALHPAVAESAVVGYPHNIKGEGIVAYIVLKDNQEKCSLDSLKALIKKNVRSAIGAHVILDAMNFVSGLPKTRSGKVMRRILKLIAVGKNNDLGDLTTLADSQIVEELIGCPLP